MFNKPSLIEGTWLEFCKIKWPTLVIGSEEYNARRKAFYAGGLVVLGIITKVPNSMLERTVMQINGELKAELKRGEAEIIKPDFTRQ